MLKSKQKAPDFTLPSTNGNSFTLSKHKGPIILYFYPKDNTRVCTKQACVFRDNFELLRDFNIDVVGISTDSVRKHINFKAKYKLPFELLADVNGEVSKMYKAHIPFLNLSKRVTYLINNNLEIVAGFSDLFNAKPHIEAMLNSKNLL